MPPIFVHFDFETQSEADIKKVGAYLYACHPSTRIMSAAYAVGGDHVGLIFRGVMHANLNRDLYELARNPNVIFVAHNAFFEMCIWREIMVKKLGYPDIPLERWKCTMAKCYASGLPGSLEGAGKALGLSIQKDKEATAVLMKLCKPKRNEGGFWEEHEVPEDYATLYRYNCQDVRSERALDQAVRDLSPDELEVWRIDQRINMQGIKLDIPAIRKAVELSEHNSRVLAGTFRSATNGSVGSPTQRGKLSLWLKDNGVAVANTQKATLTAALSKDMPDNARKAINAALEANKTSLAKYRQMLIRSKDGIIRELYQYHGAHTGRWAGRGVQWHNLARPKPGIGIAAVIDALALPYDMFSFLYGNVSDALSSALRGTVIAPHNHELFMADFAQVEARVLAWLAGQLDKLDIFRSGLDLYCKIASQIYGYPVTKKMEERQVGKVADLALGFGGGIGAFATMIRGYGVDFAPMTKGIIQSATPEEMDRAEWSYANYLRRANEPVSIEIGLASDIIKQRWRKANPLIVQYWADLERTAIEAVATGAPVKCGKITWFTYGKFLYAKLPSGRTMAYPFPQVSHDEQDRPKLSYMGTVLGKWVRIYTHGGTLSENIVQAVARDLLSAAMVRVESKYPVSFHTHDEMVAAVRKNFGSLTEFSEMMAMNPNWAPGLPIAVDAWKSERYGKAA